MALNLIVLGPPGAGKGTQADRCARTWGIPKIGTGDILRDAAEAGTEIGRRAKAIMDRGELVHDEVMIGIVQERLGRSDVCRGFILDGFPRTVAQAEALDGIMPGRHPLIVIEIAVPEDELIRRLGARMICIDCGAISGSIPETAAVLGEPIVLNSRKDLAARAEVSLDAPRCLRCGGRLVHRTDDDEAVVLERLKVYRRDTKPLVDYYRARSTFRSIDGAQSPEQVAADLAAAVESIRATERDRGAGL